MPSGAKKRKAAKKKKANDSSTTNPHQVIAEEHDGGEASSPTAQGPSVEVVKREDSSSEKISKDGNEEVGNVEIETVSKSKNVNVSSSSSSDSSDDEPHVVEKEVVVIESAPIESAPEEISPIVEPVKLVDSLIEEFSQVADETKCEEKKDLVVEVDEIKSEEKKDLNVEEVSQVVDEIKSEENKDLVVEVDEIKSEENKDLVVEEVSQVVDDCPDSAVVSEPVLKEDTVEISQPLVEKTESESKDNVSSSVPPKDLVSDVNGAGCANEVETIEQSDRQVVPAASTPIAVHNTTSWKNCCGIFELFSGSGR